MISYDATWRPAPANAQRGCAKRLKGQHECIALKLHNTFKNAANWGKGVRGRGHLRAIGDRTEGFITLLFLWRRWFSSPCSQACFGPRVRCNINIEGSVDVEYKLYQMRKTSNALAKRICFKKGIKKGIKRYRQRYSSPFCDGVLPFAQNWYFCTLRARCHATRQEVKV